MDYFFARGDKQKREESLQLIKVNNNNLNNSNKNLLNLSGHHVTKPLNIKNQ